VNAKANLQHARARAAQIDDGLACIQKKDGWTTLPHSQHEELVEQGQIRHQPSTDEHLNEIRTTIRGWGGERVVSGQRVVSMMHGCG
jgi:hypothetical protein